MQDLYFPCYYPFVIRAIRMQTTTSRFIGRLNYYNMIADVFRAVEREERDDLVNPYWMEDVKLVGKGEIDYLPTNEIQFWKDLIEAYLFPLNKDAKEQVIAIISLNYFKLAVASIIIIYRVSRNSLNKM